MRKWLLMFLAVASVAALSGVNSMAGEESVTAGASEEQNVDVYITLDEVQELTPKIEADNDPVPQAADIAETGGAPAEPEKLIGKTVDQMTEAEKASARFIWEDELYGKSFVLDSVNGAPYRSERPVTLHFGEDGRISGRICNTFHATPEFSNLMFKAGDVATTRMLCPDKELAKLEADFLKNLGLGLGYFLSGDRLELRRDTLVMDFRPEGSAPSQPAPQAAAPASTPRQQQATPPVSVGEKDLAGRRFVLAKVDGRNFSPDMGEQPFIQFDPGMGISGKACNNFRGPGVLENGVLTVENAASTMMMCIDAKLNEYETDFYRSLREGMRVSLDGKQLTLSGNGKEFVYVEG